MNSQDLFKYELKPKDKPHLQDQEVQKKDRVECDCAVPPYAKTK